MHDLHMYAHLFGEFHRFLHGIEDRISFVPQVSDIARAGAGQGFAQRHHLLHVRV